MSAAKTRDFQNLLDCTANVTNTAKPAHEGKGCAQEVWCVVFGF